MFRRHSRFDWLPVVRALALLIVALTSTASMEMSRNVGDRLDSATCPSS